LRINYDNGFHMSPELIVTNSLRQYKEFFKVVADNDIEHIKIQ
jgi:hypothetical protein